MAFRRWILIAASAGFLGGCGARATRTSTSSASQVDPIAAQKATPELEITVTADGGILVEGESLTIDDLKGRLDRHRQTRKEVWYYRQNPDREPPAMASQVIQAIVDRQMAVMLSSTPDFSTYVDDQGREHPRR